MLFIRKDSQTARRRAYRLMLKANKAFERADYAQGQALIDRAVDLAPLPQYQYTKAIFHAVQDQNDEALACCSQVLQLDSAHAAAWNLRGMVYQKLGQQEQALSAFGAAVSAGPDDPIYRLHRAALCQECGERAQAMEDYTWVIAHCADTKGQTQTGAWLVKDGNADRLDHDGLQYLCLTGRSRLYCAAGDHEKALADVERAAELRPGEVYPIYYQGFCLAALNRPQEALARYDAAAAHISGNAAFLRERGALLEALDRAQEALRDYQEALRLQQDEALARHVAQLQQRTAP